MLPLLAVCFFCFSGCDNPFAPKLAEGSATSGGVISDQSDIPGVFKNLQYAYSFKDTTIYAGLLAHDFVFTYRDYEQGFDVSWGREDEMKVTYGLFRNSERLDLILNNIVLSQVDSSEATVIRGFNLTITFNPTDILRLDGRVNMKLRWEAGSRKWLIYRWIDESNF